MVTPDEIGQVEIFAALSEATRERMSRVAADITLVPGDWAAPEGGEQALFAVLQGHIEVIKLVDGIERLVGSRDPGEVFGEVPIVLGTVFPVGFRATESTRVLRIEPHDYHSLVAAEPTLGSEVGKLASNRIGGPSGLQSIAAEATEPRAIGFAHRLHPASAELRQFLDRNQIRFRWVEPDAPDAADVWGGSLPDPDNSPVVRVIDGKTVVQPELRRVAELLCLGTEPKLTEYDTVVVGAGPAGLAAGVYGASEGLKTLVVERDAPGGQAGSSSRIENYLGFPTGVSGADLASKALQQARRLGAEILVTRTTTQLDPERMQVHLDGGDVLAARTIILASGVSWRRLQVEGFDRLLGKGISYGASKGEAPSTHGLDVHIIGGGNSAGQAAMHFSAYAKSVTLLCRGEWVGQSMSQYLIDQLISRRNIRVMQRTEVTAAYGDDALEAIDVRDAATGATTSGHSGPLYILTGAEAQPPARQP